MTVRNRATTKRAVGKLGTKEAGPYLLFPYAGKAVNVMFEAIAAAHAELAKEHEARAAGGECGGGTGEAECPRVR